MIYDELCVGVIADDSRRRTGGSSPRLADRGAEGILLGCTEIDLLVGPQDPRALDTTRLHAHRAVDLALAFGKLDRAAPGMIRRAHPVLRCVMTLIVPLLVLLSLFAPLFGAEGSTAHEAGRRLAALPDDGAWLEPGH